ncbi:MAG: hypothetical protein HYU02_05540 [Thaumarchaeota archaeon]|nr:hypothetical protein [Nitrososphaerota archaeon]
MPTKMNNSFRTSTIRKMDESLELLKPFIPDIFLGETKQWNDLGNNIRSLRIDLAQSEKHGTTRMVNPTR